MSELISGKEALIALANGEDVEYFDEKLNEFVYMDMTHHFNRKFRLKPRTIKLNGIDLPAPFEPKEGEECCFLSDESVDGYHTISYNSDRYNGMIFGLYRVSEIKQVVAALRSVFNESN